MKKLLIPFYLLFPAVSLANDWILLYHTPDGNAIYANTANFPKAEKQDYKYMKRPKLAWFSFQDSILGNWNTFLRIADCGANRIGIKQVNINGRIYNDLDMNIHYVSPQSSEEKIYQFICSYNK